ncbi:hypothetical protein [Bacillus atrophaeus]|uniref:DUF5412 domain-containing protein n=2 Tax=Bacillus atrophaeus TaxID=1452 RepID=A0ABM5LZ81_BACA1|nr:hypothetical protein [Bacillus atrophaeus]AMR62049.1 hypothetical protein A1D11_06410 [Bacillus subtilis subsp. globigii]ADP33182.1 hypothetical protein BATR1942_11255 [Bacillus atrophaeus 1942]EIM12381.1 hypothetical protein UY9_02066 [Bacillus atrophaeus C89]MBG9761342.1 hypothetical protein [Bacillus atrophaeus]MCM3458153.1 hypothetical protein [Bacillus atrophaeus]
MMGEYPVKWIFATMVRVEGVNIDKKTFKRLMIIPIILVFYVLFLNPEIVLEEQCPNKPYSLTIVKHGSGIFDKKIVFIYYKINGKTVAIGDLTFFENFGRDIDVTWDTNTDDGTWWIDKNVHLTMTYAENFKGNLDKKEIVFDYSTVQ